MSQEEDLTELIIEQLKRDKDTIKEIMEEGKDAGSGRPPGESS